MFSFDAPLFVLAGLAAATGPIIIHLLNRRRFRTVAWGAMEFLREALQRHRRTLELRDLLLLILRMLIVSLVGLALSRPYFQGSTGSGLFSAGALLLLIFTAVIAGATAVLGRGVRERWIAGTVGVVAFLASVGVWGWNAASASTTGTSGSGSRTPVHAVLIIDNSRSMGVTSTSGSRLERACQMAITFLNELPGESRMTVIPAAGSPLPFSLDAHINRSEAERAIADIVQVDAADDIVAALEMAERACEQVNDPETKRVVVLTDFQSPRWSQFDWSGWSQRLPGLQLAPVSEGGASNLSVDDLTFEDGFAGAEAPGRFLARVRGEGLLDVTSATVSLTVDGVVISSQVVELTDGQTRELEFPHRFEVGGEPGRPNWSRVELELRPEVVSVDQLPADNRRLILVPVLDAVPVVFIDDAGPLENAQGQRVGESYALRHLLAPRIANDESPRRLIHIDHVRPDGVTRELLESARLVVVAGVESPENLTEILHEYVIQGGPLVLLAGGDFDPVAWQTHGWNAGHGILPTPLLPEFLGHLPDVGDSLAPFFVDVESLAGREFEIEGEDPELIRALFDSTPFFQAVRADASAETLNLWKTQWLADWEARIAQRGSDSADSSVGNSSAIEPTWWTWRGPFAIYPASLSAAQIVDRETPRVLATYTEGGFPWVVERRMGRGTVLSFTSGVTSDWNLLRSSGAMYVFHRALFRLMSQTLPNRNPSAGQRVQFPIAASVDARWEILAPESRREVVASEVLDGQVTGVVLRRTVLAGLYELQAINSNSTRESAPDTVPGNTLASWAVQAPAVESELTGTRLLDLNKSAANLPIRVLGVGEPIRLEGGARSGETLWQWSLIAVLLGLCAEMLVLSGTQVRRISE